MLWERSISDRRRVKYLFAITLSLACTSCGSRTRNRYLISDIPQYSELKDIQTGPAVVQSAAKAVVLVVSADGSGTGSFVSATGLLMTNNHVLGVDNCARQGCYISLRFEYEVGKQPQKRMTVFAEPRSVRSDLDVSLFQIYKIDSELNPNPANFTPLATPNFLSFEPMTSAQLIGKKITLIGHPNGALKKWNDGIVLGDEGKWFESNHFSMHGNSGSPFINESGKIVGILHRGTDGIDTVSGRGIVHGTTATSSAAIMQYSYSQVDNPAENGLGILHVLRGVPDRQGVLPKDATGQEIPPVSDPIFVDESLYLAYRKSEAPLQTSAGTSSFSIPDELTKRCDGTLNFVDKMEPQSFSSPEEFSSSFANCIAALEWIRCTADDKKPIPAYLSQVPCEGTEKDKWLARANRIADRHKLFTGKESFPWRVAIPAMFEKTEEASLQVLRQRLADYLEKEKPALTYDLATKILETSSATSVPTYGGRNLRDYLLSYQSDPNYPLSISSIWYGMYLLFVNNLIDDTTFIASMRALFFDSNIAIGDKLDIETKLYSLGLR